MLRLSILIVFIALPAQGVIRSPCPQLFRYENGTEEKSWTGVLTLNSPDELYGVWIKISLDRPIDVMFTNFGLPTTKNNVDYIITVPDHILEENVIEFVRFTVKYPNKESVPVVKHIRINGKSVCLRRRRRKIKSPKK